MSDDEAANTPNIDAKQPGNSICILIIADHLTFNSQHWTSLATQRAVCTFSPRAAETVSGALILYSATIISITGSGASSAIVAGPLTYSVAQSSTWPPQAPPSVAQGPRTQRVLDAFDDDDDRQLLPIATQQLYSPAPSSRRPSYDPGQASGQAEPPRRVTAESHLVYPAFAAPPGSRVLSADQPYPRVVVSQAMSQHQVTVSSADSSSIQAQQAAVIQARPPLQVPAIIRHGTSAPEADTKQEPVAVAETARVEERPPPAPTAPPPTAPVQESPRAALTASEIPTAKSTRLPPRRAPAIQQRPVALAPAKTVDGAGHKTN